MTNPPSTAQAGRFTVLDSMRGLGCLQVVMFHFSNAVYAPWTSYWIYRNSWISLDFFFVLSGFVIAYIYAGKLRDMRSTLGFAVRRFGRIWPLHISMLTVLVAFIGLLNLALPHPEWMTIKLTDGPFSYMSLITEFFLLNSVGIWNQNFWNGAAWSVGAELDVYVIFAVVCLLFGRALVAVSAVMIIIALGAMAMWSPDYLWTSATLGIFRCMAGFFMGVIVYKAYACATRQPGSLLVLHRDWAASTVEIAMLGLLLVGVYFLDSFGQYGWPSLLSPLGFGIFVYVFAFSGGVVSRLLDRPMFHRLGDLSYSIYLTHVPVLFVFIWGVWMVNEYLGFDMRWYFIHSRLWAGVTMVGIIAVVLMVSSLTYRMIEVPWRDWFAAIGRRIERGGSRQVQPQAAE
jgi:peptidoglycan/LPS O-acetylase OafA/YrhL